MSIENPAENNNNNNNNEEEIGLPKPPENPDYKEIPSAEAFKLSIIADLESGNSLGAIDTLKDVYRGMQGPNADQFTDEHGLIRQSPEVREAAIKARDRSRTEEGDTDSDKVADRINSEFIV